MPNSSPILVSGASGFVAIHTIIQLLEQGYNVRGTIRSLAKESEVRETIAKYVQANDRLQIVSADLEQDAGWEEAMKGVEYVLHVASPFPLYEPSHEDELIIPAVKGTLRVLRAAHKAKVKRVVQVSSNAAISSGHNGENRTFTEDDWTILDKVGAYPKSKTLAELAAWDFIKSEENKKKM
jgi:dihydroflavonol-4-reductase